MILQSISWTSNINNKKKSSNRINKKYMIAYLTKQNNSAQIKATIIWMSLCKFKTK